jgi:hypothetical protein
MTQVARLLTDILPSVEVVDGTFSVDLEGVLAEGRREREEESRPSAAIPQSHDPAGRPFPFRAQHCKEDQGTHSILMLTDPHQTSSLEVSSKTIRLSLGLRPVFFPEKLMRAPVSEMTAPSFRTASS